MKKNGSEKSHDEDKMFKIWKRKKELKRKQKRRPTILASEMLKEVKIQKESIINHGECCLHIN